MTQLDLSPLPPSYCTNDLSIAEPPDITRCRKRDRAGDGGLVLSDFHQIDFALVYDMKKIKSVKLQLTQLVFRYCKVIVVMSSVS